MPCRPTYIGQDGDEREALHDLEPDADVVRLVGLLTLDRTAMNERPFMISNQMPMLCAL